MPFKYEELKAYPVPDAQMVLLPEKVITYALGIGMGADPTDEEQLKYVYEDNLVIAPMMAVVVGYPGFWLKREDTNVDWPKVLHGEQEIEIFEPFEVAGAYLGSTEVLEIYDKGPDKGAIVVSERVIKHRDTGKLTAICRQTNFCRGDGGCGGPGGSAPRPHELPDRAPDQECDTPTLPQSALLYRLSGDFNPLHADPSVARGAGFDRPILHGLCTLGHAGHALLKTVCGYDHTRFKSMKLRFTKPVYPGETLRTQMWTDDNIVSFRTIAVERDEVVLGNGRLELN